jgi:hypothetical protein
MAFGFGLLTNPISDGINKALTSKSTSTKTGTFSSTTTPTLPDWASEAVQKGAARVNEVAVSIPTT